MTTRRDFMKKATGLSIATVLPNVVISLPDSKGDAYTERDSLCSPTHAPGSLSGRYEKADWDCVFQRMIHETEILRRFGRAEDFLAVAELVRFAQEEGIRLRLTGSGCSSIIPYLLGFSDVDPLRYHLYFERFRDPQGRWAPPFVIQVDGEHQERISRIASLGYGKDFIEESIHFTPAVMGERIPMLVVESLQRERGCTVDLSQIPLDDDQAFRLIQRGKTKGFGVLYDDAFPDLLPNLRPGSIEDLAAIETLYSLSIDRGDLLEQYLQRAEGSDFPGSEDPDILDALAETRGLILYQEQIMMLLDRIGGICPADGFDSIKAAIKGKAATVGGYRAKFLRFADGNKTDKETAERLFDQITEAAGYAFCKANSVAEAMTTYKAAYLKAHYRPEVENVLEDVRLRT